MEETETKKKVTRTKGSKVGTPLKASKEQASDKAEVWESEVAEITDVVNGTEKAPVDEYEELVVTKTWEDFISKTTIRNLVFFIDSIVPLVFIIILIGCWVPDGGLLLLRDDSASEECFLTTNTTDWKTFFPSVYFYTKPIMWLSFALMLVAASIGTFVNMLDVNEHEKKSKNFLWERSCSVCTFRFATILNLLTTALFWKCTYEWKHLYFSHMVAIGAISFAAVPVVLFLEILVDAVKRNRAYFSFSKTVRQKKTA
jgi:hypothetical protein